MRSLPTFYDAMTTPTSPSGRLHPRNRHHGRYDFAALQAACPELARFVRNSPRGEPTIDFADAVAVKWLNKALLASCYGVREWDIPAGFLCPPIPGRADYIHYLADLLASDGVDPAGPVKVLDVGVGANMIYPLIGQAEYGWEFVGSDIDPAALASAARIIAANPGLADTVSLRRQHDPQRVFEGIIGAADYFDITMCNPPFHASAAAAQAGSLRKVANLTGKRPARATLNFGGRQAELWCEGGEPAFLARMVQESTQFAERCRWFSSLVSREAHLPALYRALKRVDVAEWVTIDMAQGQKVSRLVAWRFAG